jgi:two-component system, OmpR family, sensor histidine kinase ArlS
VPLRHLKTKSGQVKIRNKILIYFSSTVIALSAISLTIIYILFYEYREEEFQQQQNDKIKYTIRLLAEYKEMSEELANIMDELTIHDFYDEKMLVFDIGQEPDIFQH